MTHESDYCDSLEGSRRLRDEELLARVRRLASDDRALTVRLLVHLGEVDARGLFRDEAFTSMYAFMVEGLGMSEGEAGLRLCAARAVRRFPRMLGLFASQELHLSGIKLLSPVLNEDNQESLLAGARGQTKAGIELLLAKHFPKADVADSIRKLPSRSTTDSKPEPQLRLGTSRAPSSELNPEHGAAGAEARAVATVPLEGQSKSIAGSRALSSDSTHAQPLPLVERQADADPSADVPSASAELACKAGSPAVAHPALAADNDGRRAEPSNARRRAATLSALNRRAWSQPLSETKFRIQFTADAELLGKLKQAQALSRQPVRKEDIATVVDEALTLLIAKRHAERFGVGSRQSSMRARERATATRRSAAQVEPSQLPAPPILEQRDVRGAGPDAARESLTRGSKAPVERNCFPATSPLERRAAARGSGSDATSGHDQDSRRSQAPTGNADAGRRSNSAVTAPKAQGSRYNPVAVRQEVARRDEMRCAFVAADGRRCQERLGLEFDHRHPHARGGHSSVDNLRLLCRVHNGLGAERDFGRAFIRARIDERRGAIGPAAPVWTGVACSGGRTIPES